MDTGQFDTFARSVGSRLPRRQAVRALGALLLGRRAWHEPESASARKCSLVDERCGKGISGHCCTGSFCRRRKKGRGSCTCRPGLTNCNGSCLDIASDPLGCGTGCRTCAEDTDCCNGVCCPPRWRCCGGGCIDLTADNDNCGGCTQVCPEGLTCCDSRCRLFDSDPRHCGACGHACGAGFICQAGQCVCPPGRQECGGVCRDVQTDSANCGGCGVTCPRAYACQAGQCVCGPQSQVCYGNAIRPCGLQDHAVCTSDLECCTGCDMDGLNDGTGRCYPCLGQYCDGNRRCCGGHACVTRARDGLQFCGGCAQQGGDCETNGECCTSDCAIDDDGSGTICSSLAGGRCVDNRDCRACYRGHRCVNACVGGRCQY